MQSADFYSIFELYKERYLQMEHARENKRSLDLFGRWLKGNSNLRQIKVSEIKSKKIDMGKFLTDVVREAKNMLVDRGIIINGISLGLKVSSRCISVFKDNTIYYRIGKTLPRKGQYRGMEMLVMELVMDGNKNNVYIPLLSRIELLERQMGTEIDRENAKVEATGKYRFKLLFPLENDESAGAVQKNAKILADFIYYTRQELLTLNVV